MARPTRNPTTLIVGAPGTPGDRGSRATIATGSGTDLTLEIDVGRPDCSGADLDRMLAGHGVDRLDRLILRPAIEPVDDASRAGLRHLVAAGLEAPIGIIQALLPRLRRSGGSILLEGPSPDLARRPAVAAIGGALGGLARNLRVELRGSVGVGYRPASPLGRLASRTEVCKPDPAIPRDWRCAITGAAGGIGLALARRFAAEGRPILGIDADAEAVRRASAILEGEGVDARFVVADLRTDAGLDRIVDALADGPPLGILVQNAGVNAVGRLAEMPRDRIREILAVNLTAPLILTAELRRLGRMRSETKIVFVSSLSYYVGYPGASTYAASKDGLAAYANAVPVEGRRTLTVFPGPTRTEHARRHSPDNRREHRRMDPVRLADAIVRAVDEGRRILIPGPANRVLAALGSMAPRLTEWAMRRAILDKLDAVEAANSELATDRPGG